MEFGLISFHARFTVACKLFPFSPFSLFGRGLKIIATGSFSVIRFYGLVIVVTFACFSMCLLVFSQ